MVSISVVEDHLKKELSDFIAERNAEFHFNSGDNGAEVIPAIIKVALKNLVENGIKYNENEVPQVWVNVDRIEERQIVFLVKDNGIGIHEEFEETVFKCLNASIHARFMKARVLGWLYAERQWRLRGEKFI